MSDNLKLIGLENVAVEEVQWLWYPYIPFGKITILQGDGGDGKTAMILALAAVITRGTQLPECKSFPAQINVIYQTAEDGLGDTIKPRLLQMGADCARVLVIDESEQMLTLCDKCIEAAIVQANAKLFILDPLQAYLGANVDMHRANEVRPVFKQLSGVAERTGCAFVIIGHMNKSASKSQYRGVGSVDIIAAARSVLTVGRIKGKPYLRAFAQGKSNLAPVGSGIAFEINPDTGFRWVGKYDITVDELLKSDSEAVNNAAVFERAEVFLKKALAQEELLSVEVIARAEAEGISERTLNKAKSSLGVKSIKRGNKWYWQLPKEESNTVDI